MQVGVKYLLQTLYIFCLIIYTKYVCTLYQPFYFQQTGGHSYFDSSVRFGTYSFVFALHLRPIFNKLVILLQTFHTKLKSFFLA